MYELINKLKQNNIKVSVVGENLELDFPENFNAESIINEIKENKEALISYIGKASQIRKEIPKIDEQEYYPLSHAQRRLWIIDQLADDKRMYNVPMIHSFKTLDVEAFERALLGILARHEILRTTINVVEGKPQQFICKIEDFPFDLIRITAESDDINEIISQELAHQFDLTQSSVRASLIQHLDGSFDFIFLIHHIVTDAWSMNVLQEDFLALYEYYSEQKPLQLSDLRIQYKDYTLWQHEQLKLGHFSHSREYWLNKFSGEIPSVKLPTDFRREGSGEGLGEELYVSLPPSTVKNLEAVAHECGASFFMLMVAAANVLLHRYTGQGDLVMGTPVSGRNHPELESQVGFYSNTIVLRSSVSGNESFREILSRVSSVMLESYEHQFYPYDLLVDELKLGKDMNKNPLFDIMISLNENQSTENGEASYFEGVRIINSGLAKFDLSFAFKRMNDNGLYIHIDYNTDLFKREKILRMVNHLRNLIVEISNDSDKSVSEIEYLSQEEKHQILNIFNNTKEDYNLSTSIKDLIEEQVTKSPDEMCLLSHEYNLTFRDLNSISNQLARYLSENYGIKKGDHVGMNMDIGVDRIIALIAVVKLGAVYVPIDPSYPEERKQYIIDDTRLTVLITEDINDKSDKYSMIIMNDIRGLLNNYSNENLNVDISADDIFTILYTSGSTGNPKGVLIKNVGLINRMQWLWNTYQFGKDDVIYQKTPFIFDVSIGELFMPLCFGAKLLVATSDTAKEIISNVLQFKVTYIHFSPTMLNIFLEFNPEDVEKLHSIRYVFASGEELLKETVKRFYTKLDIPLINLYGPTEASIEASGYETKKGDEIIPIGKPIANVNLYVLDSNYKLLPIGIPGEIGIAGIGLAKGYLNQEKMTAERFIHNSYKNGEDEKIYKTGDIGLWNEKGEIEFLGRKDNQIRIGGSRIEPGEVESKILEHHGVQEVAVVVNQDNFKNYHLIAYYVKRQEANSIEESTATVKAEIISNNDHAYQKQGLGEASPSIKVHEWFEKTAEENPDRIALVSENTKMTYRELNNKANQLASLLKSDYSITGQDFVGIVMDRSEKMIVSILAILKAGAGYVPVDKEYPDSRIQTILQDAAVKVIISDSHNNARNIFDEKNIIVFDEIEKELNPESGIENIKSTEANDLCYICYTSGSTGKPKGVMIGHDSVSDYVNTFKNYFKLTEEDIVIQQSSISFDTSVEEIFPILCCGGKLIIVPEGGRDINAIIKAVNNHKVTVISTTPLVINEINIRCNDLKHIPKLIISGGEELRPSYIDKLIDLTDVYNTYGPTETTVCATFGKVDDVSKCNVIGHAIDNHKVYLLDDNMQEVKHGEIGEIFIAGTGLAKGYLNRQDETDKNFLNNPIDGGLFYKTGDMARYNDNGLLEFCGRKDYQVKIRGYRVEPAEVDHILENFNGVINCITIPKADAEGNKHLIAYYTGIGELDSDQMRKFLNDQLPHYMVPDYFMQVEGFEQTINGKIKTDSLPVPYALTLDKKLEIELRDFLRKKLPVYMIPTHFMNLDKLPVTATGKVDRKMLEKKNPLFSEKQVAVPPKNLVETKILEIWEECLKYPVKSTHVNFFEVGGNSIKATQILAMLFKEFNCDITLKDIFNNPTVVDLAEVLTNKTSDKSLIVRLNTIKAGLPNMYFIPPVIGSSTIFKSLGTAFNQTYNVYGIQYKGFDYDATFDRSIEEMAETCVAEILKAKNDKKIFLLGYSMGVPIAFEAAKKLEDIGYEVSLILVDRGPQDETSDHNLSKEQISEILKNELYDWTKDILDKDIKRIENMVFNNLNVLDKYRISGKVNADVITVEASENGSGTDMMTWKNFTSGNFSHSFIFANHYSIFDEENCAEFVKLMNGKA
nr:non-ribosomal peptide synthetase [uncultured Chryseobacterium sp.]